MSEPINAIPAKKNFDFVDTIRCISMFGIVFEHSTLFDTYYYQDFFSSMFQASVMQFFKFSTIAFFIIAGFLINHKITEYTTLQYLRNRVKSTIGPWAFWLNTLIILDLVNLFVKYFRYHKERPLFPVNFLNFLYSEYYDIIAKTSFWFILNFLICITILLVFRKYIYKTAFAVVLCLASLFYSINLYYGWIVTSHTMAMFGFVYFLWLGVYLNKNFSVIQHFISKTSLIWFIIVTGIFFVFADLETVYLQHLGSTDSYNTLRITNILYSLAFFMLLLKVGSIDFINKLFRPRETTYGIYLLHLIILLHLVPELFRPFRLHQDSMTIVELTVYMIIRFLVTYSLSILIVKGISYTKFKWSVGL